MRAQAEGERRRGVRTLENGATGECLICLVVEPPLVPQCHEDKLRLGALSQGGPASTAPCPLCVPSNPFFLPWFPSRRRSSCLPWWNGVFLPKRLLDEKGGGNGVPYIIGVNNHEAGWLIPSMIHLPDLDKGFDRKTAELILRSSAETIMKTAHEHHHIIVNEYLKDIQDPLQLRDQVLEALGDVVFVAPAIRTARHHRDAGHPTYVYEFRHSPSWHAGLRPDYVQADHGDEVFFVFGKPFLAGEGTEKERTLSKTVMKYWANFARNGDPNGPGLVTWPSYGQEEQYLDIGLKQKVAKKLKEKQVRFWTQTLPEKVAEGREGHSEL
nr:PREDICTED: fatty acyl-CoA hydrolase precursor, medium chain [Anolis carolinensis]|eukprot:XP_003230375.2 PREDICTED: fatty acyl-CoA hydrolase precursor, medium chain [Anolis carolinensis]